jgi:hypothetical protein
MFSDWVLGSCFRLSLFAWITDTFVTIFSRSYAVYIFGNTVNIPVKTKENSFYLIVCKMKQAKTGINIIYKKNWCKTHKFSAVFLIIKPTRSTNFSNLFLEWNSTCFRQFHCPSSGVFYRTHSNDICQHICMTYTIAVCTVKTPDNGERNCPKHVEFHSKNKFDKLVHLVGFIVRNISRCTVT